MSANGKNGARKLYRNDGNWLFTDVTNSIGLNPNDDNQGAFDSVWGDIDRDGDQDLIAPTDRNWRERVFINDAANVASPNHWLYARLIGPSWNTTGIGASLYATLNDGTPQKVTLRREANTNANTFNQSNLPVHFGLGAATVINRLLVRWPDGTSQTLLNVGADQYITVAYNPGDYNGDNVVDSRDYIVWRKGMGTDYTQNDYFVWRSHFGATAGAFAGNLAVPEPASLVMLLAVLHAITCLRLRRQEAAPL
jgi:hypothetical protein